MYFKYCHESKMPASNLKKNYMLLHIINAAQAVMRSLLNSFCTSELIFIR